MSTDYTIACFTCKKVSPVFASASISYGFKVWIGEKDWLEWLGYLEDVGFHEGHDLRIVNEHMDLPWEDNEQSPDKTEPGDPQ